MLRHSVSQVFGLKHPALSPRENDDIGQQPRPPNVRTNQLSTQVPPHEPDNICPNALSLNSPSQSSYSQEPISMPMPTPVPVPAVQPLPLPDHMPQGISAPTLYPSTLTTRKMDASSLHPVFFSERLQRSPFVFDAAEVTSPVAHGYAYPETQRGADGSISSRL
ncbi:hypothetical protein F5Y00DRAFT_158743 [Daldinia vernicosa]|uniref:uncharacterized protein n=1 Tax=Daldinia vernicosa TaxID=114800 RepID=UPI0020074A90|nr:uncharacterized protein F5Y00DRAFT_158743 [Daldinia vernicosa]KAI0853006.1 hypothetical protein F5Y00DRAFT_158743 [Daldinia vernicosa]